MSRNPIQWQKGLSLTALLDRYGSEAKCEAAVMAWRCPDGFVCLHCGGNSHGGRRVATAVRLPRLSSADLAQVRHDLLEVAAATDHVVPGHVSDHAVEELDLGS